MHKNRSIKPKIRWKAKKLPDVWQSQHQALEVQQALISLTQEIISRKGIISRTGFYYKQWEGIPLGMPSFLWKNDGA